MDRNRKLMVLDIVQMHMFKDVNFTKSLLQIFSKKSDINNRKKYVFIIYFLFTKDIIHSMNKQYLKEKLRVTNSIQNKYNEVQQLINCYEINTNSNNNISVILS